MEFKVGDHVKITKVDDLFFQCTGVVILSDHSLIKVKIGNSEFYYNSVDLELLV